MENSPAFQAGYHARMHFKSSDANPHPAGSYDFNEWHRGYMEAVEDLYW